MARLGQLLLAALVAALAAAVAMASPAHAHSDLESSTPRSGEVLDAPPVSVELVFNEDVIPRLTEATLRIDDSPPQRAAVDIVGPVVTVVVPEVDPSEQKTTWRVAYRVTSKDGHPITGSVEFSVRGADGESPSPDPTATASTLPVSPSPVASTTPAPDDSPSTPWVWIGLALAGVAAATAVVWRRRAG